jgi:hypothetical protein
MKTRFLTLDYDIATDPYDCVKDALERPLTMSMYDLSKEKLKLVYDNLGQHGPFPAHDWYNGSLRKWLKAFGQMIDWESPTKMYLFAIILADYMASAHNVRGAKGEKSFLAFVMQILNWVHGVRQRTGWAFPIQVNAMGKKPVNTSKRMHWQLRIANEFQTGRSLTYMCPHSKEKKTMHVFLCFLFYQADGPMLAELYRLAGLLNRYWYVQAWLVSYLADGWRAIQPLSINLHLIPGREGQSESPFRSSEEIEQAARDVQEGERTMQETGIHGQWAFTKGVGSTPPQSHMTIMDSGMRGYYHIIKGVIVNAVEHATKRLGKHQRAALIKRMHSTMVARGEETYAYWLEHSFSKIMSAMDWFKHAMIWMACFTPRTIWCFRCSGILL